jgi:spore maturation protein CgeB
VKFVFLGLSITSSWGNGHATTYRALLRALHRRGHELTFLERDVPWYADHRDLPRPDYARVGLYRSLIQLQHEFAGTIANADCVVVGSYVPQGIAVCRWVLANASGLTSFYDIDTPVTLARLERGDCDYLATDLIPRFDFYLSFTGGPTLDLLELEHGARCARPLYCSIDPEHYFPTRAPEKWMLGYLGTYSPDRQAGLERLLLAPACMLPQMNFVVAGPQYPAGVVWPPNVARIDHLSPSRHRAFYNSQRFTANLTRADMRAAGYSPSVRLFEAAACATPIISDDWAGLDEFFVPGEEILIATSTRDVVTILRETSARDARAIGERARERVLAEHTAEHRAAELESAVAQARGAGSGKQLRRQLAAKV